MSIAIGRRRSSASWPSRPAARASSAKPRSMSTGSPRSASAAPQTPAPLSGSVRPSTCGCTRPIASKSRRCGPRRPSSSAIREQHGRARVLTLCTGWPSPGTNRWAARPADGGQRQRVPAGVVVRQRRRRAASASCRKRPASSVTPRNREPPPSSPAASAPCSESGALKVGEPGGDRGRREPVVGERDQDGLEDPRLAGRRAAPATSQKASSPKPTLPMRSAARSWPSSVICRRPRSRAPSGRSAARSCRPLLGRRSVRGSVSHARISSPCSSSPGGGSAYRAGVAENVIGWRTDGTAAGPTSTTGSRPSRSAKATPPSTVLIGPHGTPAAMSSRNHSGGPGPSRSTSSGRSSSRWRCCPGCAEPRVVHQLGTPSTSQSVRNWPSLPAVMMSSSSAVGRARTGTGSGGSCPSARGRRRPRRRRWCG